MSDFGVDGLDLGDMNAADLGVDDLDASLESEQMGADQTDVAQADVETADAGLTETPPDPMASDDAPAPQFGSIESRFDVPNAQTDTGHDVGSTASGSLIDKQTGEAVNRN